MEGGSVSHELCFLGALRFRGSGVLVALLPSMDCYKAGAL